MSKAAAPIWKETLANFEPKVPACPEGVSEPAWVDLLFRKKCSICSRSAGYMRVYWELYQRFCTKCATSEFSVEWGSHHTILPRTLLDIVPTFSTSGTLSLAFSSLECDLQRGKLANHGSTPEPCTICERNILPFLGKPRENGFNVNQKRTNEKERWFGMECATWLEKMGDLASLAQTAEKQKRMELVHAKLIELGLAEKVRLLGPESSFWQEQVPRELLKKNITDRVWAGAEARVVAFVEKFYTRSLEEEAKAKAKDLERRQKEAIQKRSELFLQAYNNLEKSLPVNTFALSSADMFTIPEVVDLITQTPIDQEVTVADFNGIMEGHAALSEWWKAQATQKLLDTIRDKAAQALEVTLDEVTESALDLAFALFRCNTCFGDRYNLLPPLLSLEDALTHRCTLGLYKTPQVDDSQLAHFIEAVNHYPWIILDQLKVRDKDFSNTLKFLKDTGRDIKTTTAKMLDEVDEIFECRSCWRGDSYLDEKVMLDWHLAVSNEFTEGVLLLWRDC
ncbi:hypothetical protein CC1G_09139 [Coprinopsis cinerea okayama7|uniref:Uncharacterized protein n=1 Tax=Coprinopsis cinerea (strain Okayama-7 / 130 / ATCC MYA-4618 / FGSC 9003) TaxID=240176 RepID=A8P9P0_COPC7|nr:hypothetical protein CC1G_09139 [Coprinopsis cinerea okayama7\|eukprot:XP_001839805.2 hypothetical protein CC1G_09139 [Coprinopsis cinerea okayama7\